MSQLTPDMRFHRVVATVGAVMLATSQSPALAQATSARPMFAGKLASCRLGGLDEDVLCGHYDVPEDRADSRSRTISLNVVVLPATTDNVLGDPLFFLAGGGVVPATRYARFLAKSFGTLRRYHDVVLVDQRGTGGSNALSCDRAALDTATGLPPDERFLRYIAGCRASLAGRADVRQYTTPMAVQDLDAVRAWLGYETLDLYGASYGTSVAAAYVRRYPSRVRSVVMHGVVPLDVPMQVDLARSAQQSLEHVFALCAADAACHAGYPDLQADLTRAVRRLDATPADGSPGQLGASSQAFRDRLNAALGSRAGIREVPKLVHDAAIGALAPQTADPGPEPAPLGVRLAILCSEGLADIDTTTIARTAAATFLGERPVRFQLRWCNGWPTLPMPGDFHAPFRSSVPALLLTGELDPITPPSYADHVGAWFANGKVVRLPNRSHADTDPCVLGLIEAFIVSGGAAPDLACLGSTPPIAFMTR